jgi:formate dehydrogenase major subunit
VPPESYADARPGDRVKMPVLEARSRTASFDEVELGLPDTLARAESARCLECGCRAELDCKLRIYGARYGADTLAFAGGDRRRFDRDASHPSVVYESHKCIGCGICVRLGREVLGTEHLGFVNRGFVARVAPPFGRRLGDAPGPIDETVPASCPTGALVVPRRAP